ncbi:MAG: tRNA lysidine(34) synthetase TilS, partial [Methylobacter sp.]
RLLEHHSHPQQLIIRHWFRHLGLKMPAQAQVGRILNEVVAAAGHRDPILAGKGYSIRRYRDKLYCLTYQPEKSEAQNIIWPAGQASMKIVQGRILSYVIGSTGICREQWRSAKVEVRFRRGGEKIRLPGREGHHSLKNLFQEAGIPPWERDAMPLIYLNDRLAAVGDLWIGAAFYSEQTQDCISLILQSEELSPKDNDEKLIVD